MMSFAGIPGIPDSVKYAVIQVGISARNAVKRRNSGTGANEKEFFMQVLFRDGEIAEGTIHLKQLAGDKLSELFGHQSVINFLDQYFQCRILLCAVYGIFTYLVVSGYAECNVLTCPEIHAVPVKSQDIGIRRKLPDLLKPVYFSHVKWLYRMPGLRCRFHII
jgi:hypothetical protein